MRKKKIPANCQVILASGLGYLCKRGNKRGIHSTITCDFAKPMIQSLKLSLSHSQIQARGHIN